MAGDGGVDVWSALSDQRFQVVRMSFGVAGAVGPPGRSKAVMPLRSPKGDNGWRGRGGSVECAERSALSGRPGVFLRCGGSWTARTIKSGDASPQSKGGHWPDSTA